MLDFDGTLVNLPVDWDRLRRDISDLLARYGLSQPIRRVYPGVAQAMAELQSRGVSAASRAAVRRGINRLMTDAEIAAAPTARPLPGSRELIEALRSRRLKVIIQTSNSVGVVSGIMERHAFPPVDAIVGRESARRVKPHPQGVRRVLRQFGLRGRETVVIGDGDFDVELGRAIGATTIRIGGDRAGPAADHRVETLREAAGLVLGERSLLGAPA